LKAEAHGTDVPGSGAIDICAPFPPGVPKDENELIVPAREGALRVLGASREAKVKRVVLTSSFAAIGYGQPQPHARGWCAGGRQAALSHPTKGAPQYNGVTRDVGCDKFAKGERRHTILPCRESGSAGSDSAYWLAIAPGI
jgi:hypothetical protein